MLDKPTIVKLQAMSDEEKTIADYREKIEIFIDKEIKGAISKGLKTVVIMSADYGYVENKQDGDTIKVVPVPNKFFAMWNPKPLSTSQIVNLRKGVVEDYRKGDLDIAEKNYDISGELYPGIKIVLP